MLVTPESDPRGHIHLPYVHDNANRHKFVLDYLQQIGIPTCNSYTVGMETSREAGIS